MTVEKLANHVEFLKNSAEQAKANALAAPDNVLCAIVAKSQEQAKNRAINQYQQLQEELSGQHLAFKLTGPKADGSVRLDDFIRIFQPFMDAIKKASSLAMYGTGSLRMKESLKKRLDLELSFRLRGLSYGSTTIHFAVPQQEDTTCTSVLNNVLTKAFDLLNEQDNDMFLEKIDSIGGGAAQSLKESLKALNSSGYGAILEWNRPDGVTHWEGTPVQILRAQELLGSLSEPESYQERIQGVIASLKDTGLIEIRTSQHGKINVRYPIKLVGEVQKLKVSTAAELVVSTKKSWDEGGKKFIFHRRLLACSIIQGEQPAD